MGLGKNSRPGKRSSSSSSSSSFSTVSTVVFVAFCVIGVYMLSSSSLVPTASSLAASTSSHLARFQETRDVEASEKPLIEEVVEEKQGTEENRETVSESGGGDNQEEQEAEKGEEKQMKREESEDKKEQSGNKEDEIGGGEKMEETRAGNKEQAEGIEMKEEAHEGNQEQKGEIESGKSKEETHEGSQQEAGNESEKSQSEERKGEESIKSEQLTEVEAEKKDGDDKKPEISEEESSEERRQASQGSDEKVIEDPNPSESLSEGVRSESSQRDGSWSTQADHSENEKERRKEEESSNILSDGYAWELCNTTAGTDYIPCLDNEKAIMLLRTRKHYEHRERHCPEEPPTCLVPIPEGYKQPIQWPKSRDKIWYHNVPHTSLAEVKGHQNWVKVSGEFLTFPGGGTQFIHGALHYIDFIEKAVPRIAWGKRTRVILDVGCGVASFGGFLFDKDVLAMSFAPKDEHEAQVQFALERGIPAISAVMGTQRLPFPSKVFDIVHCARCRVPWHVEGGALLLELNRVLRPGGYFVWSATPVYQKLEEDVEIWEAMKSLTASMCWDLVTIKKDKLNSAGAAIYRKPTSNDCYNKRKHKEPPMCNEDDDPNAAWHVPLRSCMHKVPVDSSERGSQWPKQWPRRLQVPPLWLNSSQTGVYGKSAPADFISDYEHWKRVVSKSYLSGLGISWSDVRNVMDMRAVYGGFAAALRDLKVWVMNVVNVDTPDTLPIIYERGLFGIYHDWCESFSTYPRTYDLLHADQLFSGLKKRCKLVAVIAEVDRILRPGGKLIVRDESSTINEVESLLKSLHWEVCLTFSKDRAGILSAQKTDWRPTTLSDSSI